jgi:probable F420-dependent oxidoreductase
VPEHSHIPSTRKSPFPSGGDLPKKYYDVMDPFVVLGAAAAVTKTLLLGTGICLIAQRDPIQTAKQVASIDQISGGRFLFGVGNGWNEDEMANHGTAFASRHKLARERVEAMKVIWTASKAEHHGEFVNFDPMMTWPKPVQKPHPPIIVGGAFPYGARRALHYGNGWMPHRTRTQYADVQARLPKFREMAAEAWPRSRVGADHDLGRQGKPRPAQARPRRRCLTPGRQPRFRQGRYDPAGTRPLGDVDPPAWQPKSVMEASFHFVRACTHKSRAGLMSSQLPNGAAIAGRRDMRRDQYPGIGPEP